MTQLILTISDEKLADFKAGFLKAVPKPKDFAGTDEQWIKNRILNWVKIMYQRGKTEIIKESSQIEDIIT